MNGKICFFNDGRSELYVYEAPKDYGNATSQFVYLEIKDLMADMIVSAAVKIEDLEDIIRIFKK